MPLRCTSPTLAGSSAGFATASYTTLLRLAAALGTSVGTVTVLAGEMSDARRSASRRHA